MLEMVNERQEWHAEGKKIFDPISFQNWKILLNWIYISL